MDPKDYVLFNRVFGGLGVVSLLYFYFFYLLPSGMQIPSACSGSLGCTSEGMTRALHNYLLFDFQQANFLNPRVFYFAPIYLIQVAYRFLISIKVQDWPVWVHWLDLTLGVLSLVFVFILFL